MLFLSPKRLDSVWLLLGAAYLLVTLSSAKSADYFVNPNDANSYSTIQAAVDAVSGQSEFNRANIFVAPGTYHEIVTARSEEHTSELQSRLGISHAVSSLT